MTRSSGRHMLLAFLLVVAIGGLPGISLVAHAWQGEVFSPASGHAEVIAQGVSPLPAQAAWRTVFHSIPPGATASLSSAGPGFILVDTGGVLVDDGTRPALLFPSEAAYHAGAAVQAFPIGERPAGIFAIDLVAPEEVSDAGDGIPVYASAPFEAPGGARDLDLVRDLLEPDESTTVIGNAAPVLVLVTLGAIRAEATDGATATLQVGEAATFSGDIVLTGDGQAPSTFVAAVVGREAPLANGAPGATPASFSGGSVQLTVYACPPVVTADHASPQTCVRDPEAAALELAAVKGSELQDVGPASERQGLPTWTGLASGDYVLRATAFKSGFASFVVPGQTGVDDRGPSGYGIEASGGYRITIDAEIPEHALDIFALVSGAAGAATPQATPGATVAATEAAAPTAPAGPTEIPSVIQIETPVPGSAPTATPPPRATATSRPAPIVTAAARPTERALVTSTAVARPREGSIDVRVWGCLNSIEGFNPANCARAVDGYDVRLITGDGDVIGLADGTIGSDGTLSWANLPFGTYLFQQPVMLPGSATYYVPNLPLANDGSGYVLVIGADAPVVTIDVYNLPAAAPTSTPVVAPAAVDSDADGLTDDQEATVYGTDPNLADSDGDGVLDGAEVAAGTNPLVAESAQIQPVGNADSDGDRLSDSDEAQDGTDPGNPDSDGDGYFDGDEIALGTDPLDPTSFPVG